MNDEFSKKRKRELDNTIKEIDTYRRKIERKSVNFELLSDEENLEFEEEKPKLSFYYINENKLTVNDLKDGRRIFNNKTESSKYEFRENFIELRQLLFENLLLNEDFSENLNEKWTMQSAIFSTFCYDKDFIEPIIKQYKFPTLIIKNKDELNDLSNNDLIDYFHPTIDYINKWGKFHSKLMIMKFPNFLRIVIPSANLTNCDWYYWGQIIWFQDFPTKSGEMSESEFETYLELIMNSSIKNYRSSPFYKKLKLNLSDYDFSNTCVDLVASISGRFKDKNFGLARLKDLTENYNKFRSSNNRLLVQCSSFGKLNENFLKNIKYSFGICEDKKIDIIFPTFDYVNNTNLGYELSSCLFLNKDTFLNHKYKFRKFEMNKEFINARTIFHSKFIIACEEKEITLDNITDNTIFYFGSHNLSPSAWGNFEKDKKQINMANYELGVVFNPIKLRYEEKKMILSSLIINLNSDYYGDEKAWVLD
jgi:tyrosyl-DNA phosphodiesterase-1